MIKAIAAPKAQYPKLLVVSYMYAVILAALAVVQLMGVGGFEFAHISYQTPGLPGIIVAIAALEIFALPFLLRLDLSPLARFFSAVFALAAPLFVLVNMIYLIAESMLATDWLAITASVLLVVLGVASFVVLNGTRALHFPKK